MFYNDSNICKYMIWPPDIRICHRLQGQLFECEGSNSDLMMNEWKGRQWWWWFGGVMVIMIWWWYYIGNLYLGGSFFWSHRRMMIMMSILIMMIIRNVIIMMIKIILMIILLIMTTHIMADWFFDRVALVVNVRCVSNG